MSKARDLANAGTALTTVSATELGYLDGVTSAVQTQINSKEATLPSQTGNSGKYLTTDGTDKSWAAVTTLPSQTGNSGKFLTTDGTTASWATTVVDRSSSNWLGFFQNDQPGNSNNESSFSGITKDSSGNIYTVGSMTYANSTNPVFIIIKTNPLGEELLGITLALSNGRTYPQTEKIAVDSSGNIYVSGGFVDSSGLRKGFVAKLTSVGAITWTKTFDSETSSSDEWVSGIDVDSSGNIYVSGSYYSSKNNPFILKLDSSGAVQWARRIIESNAIGTLPYGMTLSSSNIYIYGRVYRGTTNAYDAFIAKYDLSGTLQWKNSYNTSGTGTDIIVDVAVDASENLYAVGQCGSNSYAFLMKLNSSGAITFSKTVNATNSIFSGVHLDLTNEHLYAVGYATVSIASVPENPVMFIVKYDTSGNIIYQRVIKNPSSSNRLFESVVSGSYLYFCGFGSFAQADYNAVLGRMNIDGSGTQRFQVATTKLSFESTAFPETSGILTSASWTSGTESAVTLTYGTYSFNVDLSYAATEIGYF